MRFLTVIFLFLMSGILFSQQIPQYTQWYKNLLRGNPAHAGINRCVDFHAALRTQWLNFQGAPNTGSLTIGIPLYRQRKKYLQARHGAGIKFEQDHIGPFKTTRVNLAYAAHFNFDKDKRISFGIYGGILQSGFNPNNVTTVEIDPSVFREASIFSADASAGALFKDEKYFVGLSLINLIPIRWDDLGTKSQYFMHAAITGGYLYSVNDHISFIPAGKIRIPVRGKISADINLHFDYKNTLGLGLGFRNNDALLFFASFKINGQFEISYSFDYTVSDIQKVANNTHEIKLRYSTCKIDKPRAVSCPLF